MSFEFPSILNQVELALLDIIVLSKIVNYSNFNIRIILETVAIITMFNKKKRATKKNNGSYLFLHFSSDKLILFFKNLKVNIVNFENITLLKRVTC